MSFSCYQFPECSELARYELNFHPGHYTACKTHVHTILDTGFPGRVISIGNVYPETKMLYLEDKQS